MSSIPNPADIRYGGFYLPVFSLLYIHREIDLPIYVPLPVFDFSLHTGNFPILLGLTFLGALIGHGESRSIYGMRGAENNPKDKWTVLWYRFLFAFKKRPGKVPKDIDHVFEKFKNSVEWFVELSPAGKAIIIFYRIGRFVITWPSKVTLLFAVLLTTWILAVNAAQEGLQLLGGLLLVGQLVFSLGAYVFNRYPAVVPAESAPWIHLAEFDKADYLYEKGEIDFEYGPPEFSDSLEEFRRDQRNVYNTPSYYEDDSTNWLIPIEESSADYLIELDDDSAEGRESSN